MISVTISNLQAAADRIRSLGGTPDRSLAGAAEDVEESFSNSAGRHNKTGSLVASVTKARAPGGWVVFHDLQRAPHALWVHWGTKPHVIFPRGRNLDTTRELFGPNGTQRELTYDGRLKPMPGGRKLVLRWPGPGGFVFSQHVNHPGYKGDPWAVEAARLAPIAFERHVNAEIAKLKKG